MVAEIMKDLYKARRVTFMSPEACTVLSIPVRGTRRYLMVLVGRQELSNSTYNNKSHGIKMAHPSNSHRAREAHSTVKTEQ